MASPGASRPKHSEKRHYLKDNTVVVNVLDNNKVKASKLIDAIAVVCGVGSIFACVPKFGNIYEVTLDCRAGTNMLFDGIEIEGRKYECHDATQKFILVSFLHLAAYISDDDIVEKLESLGVELVSPIKRRYYRGTDIADGTRYVRVKLPPKLKSLPYSMKFGNEYYRVIHDHQLKVCSLCYSEEHLFRDCPQFKCFKCGGQGHFKRTCKTQPCPRCGEIKVECDCSRAPRRDGVMTLCDQCGRYDCVCFDQPEQCDTCHKTFDLCRCEDDDLGREEEEESGRYDDNKDETHESATEKMCTATDVSVQSGTQEKCTVADVSVSSGTQKQCTATDVSVVSGTREKCTEPVVNVASDVLISNKGHDNTGKCTSTDVCVVSDTRAIDTRLSTDRANADAVTETERAQEESQCSSDAVFGDVLDLEGNTPQSIQGSLWDGGSEEEEGMEEDTFPATRARDFLKSRVEAGKVQKLKNSKKGKKAEMKKSVKHKQ